jgi:hypothetical protein
MVEDWRADILQILPYLRGQSFVRKPYTEYRPGWDHDHCAVCAVTFAEFDVEGEDVLHEGYAITATYEKGADYEWVCAECFEASNARMGWREIERRARRFPGQAAREATQTPR